MGEVSGRRKRRGRSLAPRCAIVREIGGTDPAIQLGWVSGFALLPDGGMLINDYTGRRIIEVDVKGKVVNEWRTGSRTIASIDVVSR